ncbi:MAG: CPBP family intramembrane metalloprotease [Sideroxyarcus sp.]|nr:CPBP family intramembrane metalloprotease [Sideroxyarcus sp.]
MISSIFVTLQIITIIASALRSEQVLSEEQLREFLISSEDDGSIIAATTLVTTVICCALIAVIIKLKRGTRLTDYLAIRTVPLKTALFWLAGFSLFIAASDALTYFLGRPIVPPFMTATYGSANPVWLFWIALVIAAPLFEETFFRGFLFKGLASSSIGAIGAIVLTAFFWAIIHTQYDTYNIATIFCIGLIFGAARMHTGSLLMPLVLHAFSNVVSTAEVAFLKLS